MHNLILEKAIRLAEMSMAVSSDEGQDCLIQAQDILLEHLEANPRDTDAWLLLAQLECNPPFYDPERIAQYAESVLSYDKGNVYALLFLSYADYYLLGGLNDGLIDKLSLAKSTEQSLLSLIEVAKARFWEYRNNIEYEKCLLRSIELCNTYVKNYEMLGRFYIKQGKYKDGVLLLKQALSNLERIFTPYNTVPISPVSIKSFLDEFFTGMVMNYMIHNDLCALVKEYENAQE